MTGRAPTTDVGAEPDQQASHHQRRGRLRDRRRGRRVQTGADDAGGDQSQQERQRFTPRARLTAGQGRAHETAHAGDAPVGHPVQSGRQPNEDASQHGEKKR